MRRCSSLPSETRSGLAGAAQRAEQRRGSLQLPRPQDSSLSLADRISRSNSPAGQRSKSSSSSTGRWRFAQNAAGKEISHEGWLAKRSSGKIARWQQRYFRLEGCFLRYTQTPASNTKKTFNLQKAHGLSVEDRELVLDFGFRCWRLRAMDPEEARRWLVMLEAGRLVAGDAEDGDASESDDESLSLSSANSGSTTAESEVSTPKFGQRDKARHRPAPPIAEMLEVDGAELDRRFESWLPKASGTALSSTATVRDGLRLAWAGLWEHLAGAAGSQGGDQAAAEQAVAALLDGSGDGERNVARESLENFLGEYLLRLRRSLEAWMERRDPNAEDVALVAQWLLFEAQPDLQRFSQRVEKCAGRLEQLAALEALERLLLREWETRSCEEASAFWASIFENHYAPEAGRVSLTSALRRLESAAAAGPQLWRGHRAACDRAASVLVATLNGALRSLRASSRALVEDTAKHRGGRRRTFPKMIESFGRQALHEIQKAGTCSDSKTGVSEEILLAAAEDAARLARFCGEAEVGAWGGQESLCHEVLQAFAGAFEAEVAALCHALLWRHFRRRRRLCRLDAVSEGMRPVAEYWRAWSRQSSETPRVAEHLAQAAAELLTSQWLRAFRHAEKHGGALPHLEEDEAVMAELAPGSPQLQRFQATLGALRLFLRSPSWAQLAQAEQILQQALGEEEGRSVAQHLWRLRP
ncbi:unnamed protein product [Effrenium voratum]|nr:unnamed protein product [Effrenium voratum]